MQMKNFAIGSLAEPDHFCSQNICIYILILQYDLFYRNNE